MSRTFVTAAMIFLSTAFSWASSPGVITMTNGRVEILRTATGGGSSYAMIDGQKYKVEAAKIGVKIKSGDIVRTGPDGKARIVFLNGDTFTVGPGTSHQLSWSEKTAGKANNSTLNLAFGKVRAMVDKDGPRTGLKVKTPAAVAGVRGTDFFIGHNPSADTSEISVLRGEVEVKAADKPKAEPVKVTTGFKAEVEAPTLAPTTAVEVPDNSDVVATKLPPKKVEAEAPKIELRRATQTELIEIQQASSLKAKPEEIKDVEVKKEVEKLEGSSQKAALEELKEYDPALYEQVKAKDPQSAQEISGAVIAKLFVEAPKAPQKPSLDSLKDLDQDMYDKYFKQD